MKKIKKTFLLAIFAFLFLTFISINVSANAWEVRSLPTVYKLTGEVTLDDESGYFFLVAYVSDGADNYPLATTNICKQYSVFENDLTQGIFVGPLNSQLPGLEINQKNFDLSMRIYRHNNETNCNNALEPIEDNAQVNLTGFD